MVNWFQSLLQAPTILSSGCIKYCQAKIGQALCITSQASVRKRELHGLALYSVLSGSYSQIVSCQALPRLSKD